MDEPLNTVFKRLRLAREQAGLSQGQIAKLVGYHRPTISEIEGGRRKVTAEEVAIFAKHYGVSASWIINQESTEQDPAVELAARELSNLKPEDLSKILRLLQSLKKNHPKE